MSQRSHGGTSIHSCVSIMLYAPPKGVKQQGMKILIAVGNSPLPIVFVSTMPDVHLGEGLTIGSVFASEKYVRPNAVGVDVVCGMCAIPVGLYKDDLMLQQKEKMQSLIKHRIPMGFNQCWEPLPVVQEALDEISHQKPRYKTA